MTFWRALEILAKRKWLIVMSVLVATTLTWGATRLVGSKWQATVKLVALQTPAAPEGNPNENKNGPVREAVPGASQAAFYTGLAQSRAVLEPVLKDATARELTPEFVKGIVVLPNGDRLFQLQVMHTTATRAQAYANAIADKFVEKNHELYTENAQRGVQFLETQLKEQDTKLQDVRNRYDIYRRTKNVIGPLSSTMDPALARLKEAKQKRDEIHQQLADVQAQIVLKESSVRAIKPTISTELPQEPVSMVGQQYRQEITQIDAKLIPLRARFTDSHPEIQKLLTDRANAENKLREEQRKPAPKRDVIHQQNPQLEKAQSELTDLRQKAAGLQAELRTSESTLADAQAAVNNFKGLDTPINTFITELAQETEARSNLAARLHNARLALDAVERQNPLAILDHVGDFNPPVNTTQGRSMKLMLLAALCALVATSALIIAFDSIDRRLRSVKEAEVTLPAKVIAAIPQPIGAVTYGTLARATELHPQSIHSEAYRFLGMHLLNGRGPKAKSIMVLSAKAEQGATTTVTNLGITLAQSGKKVIIVDANVRTSELHRVFDANNQYGFTDILTTDDPDALAKALQPTSTPNLHIITSGPMPGNPWEMFRSPKLQELAQRLMAMADYVLWDTPSALIFTDALNLAPVVDSAFLCVRALEPLTGAEHRLVELLKEANVEVLGSVLNDVPASVVEGYANYQHYYQPAITVDTIAPGSTIGVGAKSIAGTTVIDLPQTDTEVSSSGGHGKNGSA